VLQTRLLGYHVVTFSIHSAAMPPQKCLVSPQNPLFSHQIINSNSFLVVRREGDVNLTSTSKYSSH